MNQAANANLFSRLFDGLDDPKRLAIETHDGTRISYGDLIARAGQMANVLVARGVKPGDRVAVQVEKSVANIVLYLATVRAGAVYLPLNTAYTLNELDYFIGDAEPSLVVCDPSKAEGLAPIAAKVKATVETLGPDGKGSLTDAAAKAEQRIHHRAARERRSRRDPLHVGHDGAFQGRDADPRQSGVELADAWSAIGASPTRTC